MNSETPALAALIWLDKLIDAFPFLSRRWQTLSARTGYAAYRGKAWGRVCAKLIDALFGKGHCFGAAVAEGLIPTSVDAAFAEDISDGR